MIRIPSFKRIIVGLGNPGKDYAATRHNIGFTVAKAWAQSQGIQLKEVPRLQAWVAEKKVGDLQVYVVLPKTYMNASGIAVKKCVDFFKLEIQDLIVISDDADLPFGIFRLKMGGGSGGHNGLKSIKDVLGTQDYLRLKIGIDRSLGSFSLSEHVLGEFSKEERVELPAIIEKGVKTLDQLLHCEVAQVMNEINQREVRR